MNSGRAVHIIAVVAERNCSRSWPGVKGSNELFHLNLYFCSATSGRRSKGIGESGMKDPTVRLAPREQQIAELLLQGCDNDEIGKELKMARRTVKAHFNRLFLRFGIRDGVKRVKLATLLYRRQLCSEANATENEAPASESAKSSPSSPKDLRTEKSLTQSEQQSTSSRTTSEPSTISSASGTGSNLPFGTKPAATKASPTPDDFDKWERRILDLKQPRLVGARDLEN
jgi:DNA-binding CsgD family transcriptional regulator